MKREPAVAGYFYSENKELLKSDLKTLIKEKKEKIKVKGIVVPHAGYMYSGWVAGQTYGVIYPPEVVFILGPNHTGLGKEASIFNGDSFVTPLGEAPIAKNLALKLLEEVPFLEDDPLAHIHEHSLEVQVPFLQYLNPKVEIVPLCLGKLSLEEIVNLGKGIAKCIKEEKKYCIVLASSDFSHYVPQEVAKKKDFLAIEQILNLSEGGLLNIVQKEKISMCGVIPVAVMIYACKELGAKKAELVVYGTSGDVIRDYSSVVGYAGIIIY